MNQTATLLISCPDRKGLSAAIANFLYTYNANIVHSDQHQDSADNLFLMRIEWDLADFTLDMSAFSAAFQPIADRFEMTWKVALSNRPQKMAIFVSKYDHCLVDLLHRHKSGELNCEIPLIISNHEDCRALAEFYGIEYHVIPVTKDNKVEAEAKQKALLAEKGIDLIVLARYMQVLSHEFTAAYPQRVINIHHSFLPAFDGAKPYHRAFARGVKLIGATSHYVTEILDDGPIIEQDVNRISHRDNVDALIQKGRDLERVVLSRAVRWHLEHRVLVYSNKTVIFD
ncbi:formyltetrahydrofolate deformylase [Chitinibacter bivalviorum]|uniref:Formyltetrahydrofolate deformylase n=1 Tax=Chitinibacter bivalviorum TaxID=2739434 RepID=A0A7H9BF86_9NEIS|nr:formyltetrahydrofolate deformylase [Chitinibacter bivalviorum]QLG87237.1 formyltetrahydrofolate deformylase [Chitinibacter bivalviorum]